MRSRLPSRVDGNQGEIVSTLRAVGLIVIDLHALGDDYPDLLVGDPRECRWVLVEVKTPTGKLRKGQREFMDLCRANNLPCIVATSANAALEYFGRM